MILSRRENARRVEDGPTSSCGRGHRRRVTARTACLRARAIGAAAAARPEGSRPEGAAGRRPGVGELPAFPPAPGEAIRRSSDPLDDVASSPPSTAGAGCTGAPKACP